MRRLVRYDPHTPRVLRSVLALGCLSFTTFATFAAADAPRYELDGAALKVPHVVAFEAGSDKLKPESDDAIAYVAGYLDAKSYISTMRIESHTDSDGRAAANQTLSEKRALAVARALVKRGVDCKRLVPVGFGDTKPVASNDTPENKSKNRRTVFANAALRGHAIGGAPLDGGGKVAGDPCS